MKIIIGQIVPWGPVFFGGLVFAQMWSATLDISLPITAAIGLAWGFMSMKQGRWL